MDDPIDITLLNQADPAIILWVVGPARRMKVDDQAVDQVFDPGISRMGLGEGGGGLEGI
jgi:hypothetical protein